MGMSKIFIEIYDLTEEMHKLVVADRKQVHNEARQKLIALKN